MLSILAISCSLNVASATDKPFENNNNDNNVRAVVTFQPSGSPLKDMFNCVTNHVTIWDAIRLTQVCRVAREGVHANLLFQSMRHYQLSPEPTIPLWQAAQVRLTQMDASIAQKQRALAEKTLRELTEEEALYLEMGQLSDHNLRLAMRSRSLAKRDKDTSEVDAQRDKNELRYDQLSEETTRLETLRKDLQEKIHFLSTVQQDCEQRAVDLGEAEDFYERVSRQRYEDNEEGNIQRENDRQQLQRLVDQGRFYAIRAQRDLHLRNGDDDAAKALNERLIEMGSIEAKWVKKEQWSGWDFELHQQLNAELVAAGYAPAIIKLKFAVYSDGTQNLPFELIRVSRRSIQAVRKAIQDYDWRSRLLFSNWFDQVMTPFAPVAVSEQQTEDEANIHDAFKSHLCAAEGQQPNFSEAITLFAECVEHSKLKTVNQLAWILDFVPCDDDADFLRQQIVDQLKVLKPSFNEIDGVYHYLTRAKTAEEKAQVNRVVPTAQSLAALKFARAIGYVPKSMR
jgi:hypothetical protein